MTVSTYLVDMETQELLGTVDGVPDVNQEVLINDINYVVFSTFGNGSADTVQFTAYMVRKV